MGKVTFELNLKEQARIDHGEQVGRTLWLELKWTGVHGLFVAVSVWGGGKMPEQKGFVHCPLSNEQSL